MALELFLGAGLGVLFDQLRGGIFRVKNNFEKFKPKLEELDETLAMLDPVIGQIDELNGQLNGQNHGEETIKLRRLLIDGTKLVEKCSKIPRLYIFKQDRYIGKLAELDNKIVKFHMLYMQAYMARDQKQDLLSLEKLSQKQNMTFMMIMLLNQRISSLTMAITDSSHLTPASSTGSSNMTLGIAASSTDAHGHSLKIVMKVHMPSDKCRTKALKVVACFNGVKSVGLEDDTEKLVVIGRVDAVMLIKLLRKRVGYADILRVGRADILSAGRT